MYIIMSVYTRSCRKYTKHWHNGRKGRKLSQQFVDNITRHMRWKNNNNKSTVVNCNILYYLLAIAGKRYTV